MSTMPSRFGAPGRSGAWLPVLLAVPVIMGLSVSGAGRAEADTPDFVVTVGIPGADGYGDGEVDNRVGRGGVQLIDEQRFGVPHPETLGGRFGAAILSRDDVNDDYYDDLIVGAPGSPGVWPTDVPGQVDVFFGSPNGVLAAGAVVLQEHASVGDEFGAALALSGRGDGSGRDLWVGAPGHDVSGKANAGAVFRYLISPTGAVSYVETITQDSPLVPGSAEAGDRFGEVLARDGVVGIPSEDIGTRKDAGTVQHLRTDPETHALIAATDYNQNTAGVPGVAEAGDRFGAAVTAGGGAVGAPGEDVGTIRDAGLVQAFGSGAFSQNSAGIPGRAEAGDRFGAALSEGVFQCQEQESVAAGAPGEDVGTVKDAGSVTLMLQPFYSGSELEDCPARVLSQGSGLPGRAEAGDQVGAAIGWVSGDPDLDEDRSDTVLIGVPGEDIGTIMDAGRVYLGARESAGSFGYPGGDVKGLRYGANLPS